MLKTIRKHITARITVNNALDKVVAARKAADLLKEEALLIIDDEMQTRQNSIEKAYQYAARVEQQHGVKIEEAVNVKSALLTA